MEIYELDQYLRDNSNVHDKHVAATFCDMLPTMNKLSSSQQHKFIMDQWEQYLDKLIVKINYVMQNDPHYSTDEWIKFIEDTDLVSQLEEQLYRSGLIW